MTRPFSCFVPVEKFSQGIGLIPEQIWDRPDVPPYLCFGGATDAAMSLIWAHAEYVKLYRSASDRQVFDLVEPAYDRYVKQNGDRKIMEVWKSNRQVQTVPAGTLLRIQANSPFLLVWTSDDWQHSIDAGSQGTAIEIEFVDIPLPEQQQNPIRFTFLWLEENRWEGKNYAVNLRPKETKRGGTEPQNECSRKKRAGQGSNRRRISAQNRPLPQLSAPTSQSHMKHISIPRARPHCPRQDPE